MRCTCPVCGQSAEYEPRYAGKWHRCAAGCQAVGTRLLVVPDGVGVLEEQVAAAWRADALRGRLLRAVLALPCLLLVAAPILGPALRGSAGVALPHAGLLLLAGLGAGLAAAALHAAWRHQPPRPPGL